MKAFLELQIDGVVSGKTIGFRGRARNDLSLAGQVEEWQHTVSDEAVGRIPPVRTGQLRAQQRNIQTEIEHLVGVRAGASVGAEDLIVLAEAVTQTNGESIVAIVALVLEDEVAVHRAI